MKIIRPSKISKEIIDDEKTLSGSMTLSDGEKIVVKAEFVIPYGWESYDVNNLISELKDGIDVWKRK